MNEYRPGQAAVMMTALDEQGVEVRYSYLSSIDPRNCFMILETTNNDRALEVFGQSTEDKELEKSHKR